MNRLFILAAILFAALIASPQVWGERSPRTRLAETWARTSLRALESDNATLAAGEGAVLYLREAARIDPDNVKLWRLLLEAADFLERPEVADEAVENITRLDPADTNARLRRVMSSVSKRQTAQRRLQAYEQLLTPGNQQKLGPPVSSRIAYAAARLNWRRGNLQGYADRLAEAAAIDPANVTAIAEATGFYRSQVDDPLAEAELWIALILADPTNLEAHAQLAWLMMDNGAYKAAARLYRIAVAGQSVNDSPPAGLLADLAIAQWGAGKADAALETIAAREAELDRQVREAMQEQDPTLTTTEATKMKSPLPPVLAAVQAAILSRQGDSAAKTALEAALASYQQRIKYAQDQDAPPSSEFLASINLKAAWLTLWLGDSTDRARSLLEAAAKQVPLTEQSQQRFNGWLALRENHLDVATEYLSPIAKDDLAAAAGLALTKLQQGKRKAAATDLLRIARTQPGTLLGVWSADVLYELLGQRASLTNPAKPLNDLVATIPSHFDRFAEQPMRAVEVRVLIPKKRIDAYEPVIFNLEFFNNSTVPLEISSDGPIRSQVFVQPDITIVGLEEQSQPEPIIFDIDRRLRLEPRERLVVPIDLSLKPIGDYLINYPLRGATIGIEVITNYSIRVKGGIQVVEPGVLGSRVRTDPIRVDGVSPSPEWFEQAIEQISDPTFGQMQRLTQMAFLAQFLNQPTPEQLPTQERKQALETLETGRSALAQAYAACDPACQAWMLGVLPGEGEVVKRLLDIARTSENRLVMLSYLLFRTTTPDDPMLDAAKRSGNESLIEAAEIMHQLLQRRLDQSDSQP